MHSRQGSDKTVFGAVSYVGSIRLASVLLLACVWLNQTMCCDRDRPGVVVMLLLAADWLSEAAAPAQTALNTRSRHTEEAGEHA